MLYESLILRAKPKGTESLRRQLAEPYRTLSRAYDLITITLKPILPHDRQNRPILKRRFSGSDNLINELLRSINGFNS
jgi:hypothetical protein